MPIDYHSLVTADRWIDLPAPSGPAHLWAGGGLLDDAPVDAATTFAGSAWVSAELDPSFGVTGLRLAPDATTPRHHHDTDGLILVFDGLLRVAWDEPDGTRREQEIGRGAFWVSSAGTAHVVTAGPEGATYGQAWPSGAAAPVTTWYDEGWVAA